MSVEHKLFFFFKTTVKAEVGVLCCKLSVASSPQNERWSEAYFNDCAHVPL